MLNNAEQSCTFMPYDHRYPYHLPLLALTQVQDAFLTLPS